MSSPFLGVCTCPRIISSSVRSAWTQSASSRGPPQPTKSRSPTQAPRSYDSQRGTTSSNGEVWRSTSKITPKKSYLDSTSERTPASRGIGKPAATTNYSRLRPEAQRREDAYSLDLQKDWSPAKLHAMERERARAAAVAKTGYVEKAQEDPSSSTGNSRSKESNYQDRGEGVDGTRDVASNRYTNQVNRHSMDRTKNQSTTGMKLIPGTYNRSLRDQGSERKIVQPIVRGGAPRKSDGQRIGKKKIRSEMKKVVLPSTIRLENLTNLLGVRLTTLQRVMQQIGLENTRAERLLNAEDASLVALELNFDPVIDDEGAFDIYPAPPSADPALLPLRPPVTGIFGHVDHGKTSLLDALRSTTVASGEAGGITQHIGAFQVSVESMVQNLKNREAISNGLPAVNSKKTTGEESTITFLDTPGHAAFTAMRERGAGVTDVVVLVVAADDGVKPQTQEVIGLIKTADVGVVVAITKVDKPGVDVTKVKQSLMAAGVEVEDFGGDVPCVEVSSVTGQGLPELLETISAIAEVRELKAERDGRVEGRVIESRVEKGRGNVATVLVLRGCLRPAASLIAGTTWCRVRQLTPAFGSSSTVAYPGQPVEVTGWKDLPSAGDEVLEGKSEDEVKKAVANRLRRVENEKLWADVEIINEKRRIDLEMELVRKEEERKAKAKGLKGNAVTSAGNLAVEEMDGSASTTKIKELVLIIKADVSGTVEAVIGALEGIGNKEAKVKIIYSGVGDVQESDVEMAKAVQASIVGFNVKASRAMLQVAARPPYNVPIHTSPIIYRLVETISKAVADLLPKITETRVHGEATVQQIFEITIKGQKDPMKVAGCKVGNGVFQKGRKARVMRGGIAIHTGTVDTLKQAKKDVSEISKGTECGIALEDFDSFEEGDILQSVELYEIPRTL